MRQYWKLFLGIVLLVGLVVYVEYELGWQSVLSGWLTISPSQIFFAFSLMAATYILRAIRFYDFFYQHCRGHALVLFRLTVIHNFFNNLLPMRSGEAAFPLLMKRYFQVAYRHSTPALLWLRLLDLYALIVLALITLQHTMISNVFLKLLAASALLAAPLLLLPIQQLTQRWLTQQSSQWSVTLSDLFHILPRSLWTYSRAMLWTYSNWALKIAVYAWIIGQFANSPFFQSWVGASSGELSSILPIHGVAGAGTYEAGVVAGLIPWGIEPQIALTAAVNLHLFVLASTLLITGIVVVCFKGLQPQQR